MSHLNSSVQDEHCLLLVTPVCLASGGAGQDRLFQEVVEPGGARHAFPGRHLPESLC